MKSSNPWRFRLRLQIINKKRNLIIDTHWCGMGVCIKIRKKDYEWLKKYGIHEHRPINITGLRRS